jgi:hypothetical protein
MYTCKSHLIFVKQNGYVANYLIFNWISFRLFPVNTSPFRKLSNEVQKRSDSTNEHSSLIQFPKGITWSDPKNHKKFMDFASIQLKINVMDDWYKVTSRVPTHPSLLFTPPRILSILAASHFSRNITTPLIIFSPQCSQNTNGYHGNFQNVLQTIGTVLIIKEYSWNM